jgi:hypothetical protein
LPFGDPGVSNRGMSALYTRDGHLLDLTIDRLLVGEISVVRVREHLRDCPRCRDRIDAAMAVNGPPRRAG